MCGRARGALVFFSLGLHPPVLQGCATSAHQVRCLAVSLLLLLPLPPIHTQVLRHGLLTC